MPISSKIIPSATNNPTGETFLVCKAIDTTRSNFQYDGSDVQIAGKSNKGKIKRSNLIFYSSSSVMRFNFTEDTGATISGNFSTVTVDKSRPNPFSSDKLISLSQK